MLRISSNLCERSIGGGGGNRTRVRKSYVPGSTCLARCLISSCGNTTCKAHRKTSLLELADDRQAAIRSDLVIVTLHPRAQAQVGSGLSLKRLERSCRRWQLKFAAGLTRKAAPSACTRRFRDPRRSRSPPEVKTPFAVYGCGVAGFKELGR
jgi:hypothetical protein